MTKQEYIAELEVQLQFADSIELYNDLLDQIAFLSNDAIEPIIYC